MSFDFFFHYCPSPPRGDNGDHHSITLIFVRCLYNIITILWKRIEKSLVFLAIHDCKIAGHETPGLYLFFIVVYTTTSCLFFFFFFLFGPIIVMSPLFSPSSLMPQSGIEGNSKKKKKKKKELLGGVPSVCLKCEEAATISPHLVSWKSSSSIRKQQQKKKRKCTAEVD